MDARRVAAVTGLGGGVVWLVKVVLVWADTDAGVVEATYVLGLGALVAALAVAGYSLAERAPIWLRGIVVLAVPLLVVMVWVLLDQAVRALYPAEGWRPEEVTPLLTGLVALALGMWGLRRGRAAGADDVDSTGGHRARR